MKFTVELTEREWSRVCVALNFYDRQIHNRHNSEIAELIYTAKRQAIRIPLERKGGEVTL